MFDSVFRGLFDTDMTQRIPLTDFLLCVGVSLLLGLLLSLTHAYRSRCTGSFVVTLALLPAVVCVVIMMVNGNIGAGVAVAGTFGLVRFRSAPGTAREILMLFLAMAAGLLTGMGYLAFAVLFTAGLCGCVLLYQRLGLGGEKTGAKYKTLNITIPEDLDYGSVFEDIFREYAADWELVRVKTTDMGSLFRLTYELRLRDEAREKEMIDKLRCRNGNLEISISRLETAATEL